MNATDLVLATPILESRDLAALRATDQYRAHWLFGSPFAANIITLRTIWRALSDRDRVSHVLSRGPCMYVHVGQEMRASAPAGGVYRPMRQAYVRDFTGDSRRKPVDMFVLEMFIGVVFDPAEWRAEGATAVNGSRFPKCGEADEACGEGVCINPFHHPWFVLRSPSDLGTSRKHWQRPRATPHAHRGLDLPEQPLDGMVTRPTLPLPPPPQEWDFINNPVIAEEAPAERDPFDVSSYIWPTRPSRAERRAFDAKAARLIKRAVAPPVDAERLCASLAWRRRRRAFFRADWELLPHCRRMKAVPVSEREREAGETRMRIKIVTDYGPHRGISKRRDQSTRPILA